MASGLPECRPTQNKSTQHILENRTSKPFRSTVIIQHLNMDSTQWSGIQVFDDLILSSTHIIITDDNVSKIYLTFVLDLLGSKGIQTVTLSMKPGEVSKSLQSYSFLLNQAIDIGIDRHSSIIGLGGGVVKDISGMVASTLYRGLNLIHVPTTVLAQVDAAIDFNQAVNMPQGKNLVGTFFPASVIWINNFFLRTLDDLTIKDGLASQQNTLCAKARTSTTSRGCTGLEVLPLSNLLLPSQFSSN